MCLGIPGQIVRIDDAENAIATVDICGVQRRVNIACVADGDIFACLGSWVLVHVGFAMARIDEQEAQETLRILAEIAQLNEELTWLATAEAGNAAA